MGPTNNRVDSESPRESNSTAGREHRIREAEEWRPVVGWEPWYEVSNLGRVRRIGAGKGATVGMVVKPGPAGCGYLKHKLSHSGGKGVDVYVHHMVAAAFLGPCPEGLERDHINGDRIDNRAENLRYVTPAVNRASRHLGRGSTHYRSLFTETQVDEMRRLDSQGIHYRDIAEMFKAKAGTVWAIVRFKCRLPRPQVELEGVAL
jgi:hypothetical protein